MSMKIKMLKEQLYFKNRILQMNPVREMQEWNLIFDVLLLVHAFLFTTKNAQN